MVPFVPSASVMAALDAEPLTCSSRSTAGSYCDTCPCGRCSGQVGTGHRLTLALGGIGAVWIGHPPRHLAVLPAERCGAAAQHLARCAVLGGHGADIDGGLDLVGDRKEFGRVEVGDAEVVLPTLEQFARRAPVEAAVDLGAAAGAATLGVGERRSAECNGDAPGPVLPFHLIERERNDFTLLDPRTFLDHQHVEAGFGQDGGGGGPAGTTADDEDVGLHRGGCLLSDHRESFGCAPVGDVSGQCSHT